MRLSHLKTGAIGQLKSFVLGKGLPDIVSHCECFSWMILNVEALYDSLFHPWEAVVGIRSKTMIHYYSVFITHIHAYTQHTVPN